MTRVRNKNTVAVYPQPNSAWNSLGASHDASSTISVLQRDEMVDVVTPGFRKESRKGNVYINDMTRIKTTITVPPLDWWKRRTVLVNGQTQIWHVDNGAQAHIGTQDTPWTEKPVVSQIDHLEGMAVTSAYASVGEADLEVLTELAELRETLSFLASPAVKLKTLTRRLLDHVQKVERYKAAYAAKVARWERKKPRFRGPPPVKGKPPKTRLARFDVTDIPSAWLAYRYAVMPLIYSIQDIQKHLSRSDHPIRMTSRGKASSDVTLDLENVVSGAESPHSEWGSVKYAFHRRGNAKVTCRAGVLYVADWSVSRQLGLQLHKVPTTLYEVIPLSFVADWFWNGADYYRALTAEFRAQGILGAWVTTTIDYDYTYRLVASPNHSDTTCSPGGISVISSGTWKRRRKVNVSDAKLGFQVELSTKRVADALALSFNMLATAMRKSK